MEWNRAVDKLKLLRQFEFAIVSGVSETEVVELKKTEITDRVKESVEQNGQKPELFGDIGIRIMKRLVQSMKKPTEKKCQISRVSERIRQKEQIIKEREASRVNQERQKDKVAR